MILFNIVVGEEDYSAQGAGRVEGRISSGSGGHAAPIYPASGRGKLLPFGRITVSVQEKGLAVVYVCTQKGAVCQCPKKKINFEGNL
jgi:hypothetical protein